MENGGNPAFSIFNFQFSIRLAKRGAPTPCSHHISETISSPFRGAFHLSLTVLSAIDLCTCLALDEVVHPDSDRITRVRSYLGILSRVWFFRRRGSHPLWPPVPGSFA